MGGRLQNGRGACEVLPLRRGGRKSFCYAEGGHKFWGSFYVVALSFSHIEGEEGGGARSFDTLKEGMQKVLPCLEGGGGAKCFGPAIFPFLSPPLPIINDQFINDN